MKYHQKYRNGEVDNFFFFVGIAGCLGQNALRCTKQDRFSGRDLIFAHTSEAFGEGEVCCGCETDIVHGRLFNVVLKMPLSLLLVLKILL